MQLDHTSIVIRERPASELIDLALFTVSRRLRPLLFYFLLGAAPWVAVNSWLLADEAFAGLRRYGPERFLVLSSLLTYLAAPIGGSLATVYLGQAMFYEPTDLRTVLTRWLKSLPQAVYFLGLWRGLIPAWILATMYPADAGVASLAAGFFWLMLIVLAQRVSRPYLPEVILLERNPWRSEKRGVPTTGRRSRDLHRSGFDLFGGAATGCWFATGVIAGVAWSSWRFAAAVVDGDWTLTGWSYLCGWQASLWAAALFATVNRFLGYLDLRIRSEGWEVELRLRAEAQRLEGAPS